jgi:hypothetical protein
MKQRILLGICKPNGHDGFLYLKPPGQMKLKWPDDDWTSDLDKAWVLEDITRAYDLRNGIRQRWKNAGDDRAQIVHITVTETRELGPSE